MEKDSGWKQYFSEDAFDIVALYTNATELIQTKENWRKGGKVDMCTALTKLIAEGRDEGRDEGRREGRNQGIEENTRRIVLI